MTGTTASNSETQVKAEEKVVAAAKEAPLTPRQTLDEAHRSMALKQWEKAADQYAIALEALNEQHAEDAPVLAPILHRYGRCLLEHAIATSGALGAGGGAAGASEAPLPKRKVETSGAASSKPADPRFSFGGDAEDEEDEEDEGEGQEAEGDDVDDLSTAFSVLDLARIIYQRLLQGGSEDESAEDLDASLQTLEDQTWDYIKIKTELAEVLNDLGDVGLESENFSQASSDYESSLLLISPMLHPHSRRLADAYLRLGLALEFHPDTEKQSRASKYVQSAAHALQTRLDALQSRQKLLAQGDEAEARAQAAAAKAREEKALLERKESEEIGNGKGKGKRQERLAEKDDVAEMDEVKVEKEIKDVEEMIGELNAKLEEYNHQTNGVSSSHGAAAGSSTAGGLAIPESAKLALQQAINDAFLGASTNSLSSSVSTSDKPVTDITGMVKRKKRAVEEGGGEAAGGNGIVESVEPSGKSLADGGDKKAGTAGSSSSEEPKSKKTKVEDAEEA